jgi:virulence-associated protein VapD
MNTTNKQPEPIFINEPDKRRVILVLSGNEVETLKYDWSNTKRREEQIFTNGRIKDGICIVANDIESYGAEEQKFLQSLKEKNLLDAGNILIQDSYNPSLYYKSDTIQEKVSVTKWRHYATLCNYLGAKDCKIKIVHETRDMLDFNFMIEFITIPFGIITGGSSNHNKLKKEYMEIVVQCEQGGLPNIQAAIDYVRKYSLEEDDDISFLIDNRKSALPQGNIEYPTNFCYFKQKINLLSRVESNIKLAAGLVIPEFLTTVRTKFNKNIKKVKNFSLEVEVNFSRVNTNQNPLQNFFQNFWN